MSMDWEQRNLMNELKKGKELAEELRNNSFNSISSSQILVDKLLFSYEKALSLLNCNGFAPVSDQLNGCKKRKKAEKFSELVKVGCGNGSEGSVDDGFSWRKYGQKDILGSKFPRGYYRCSHRNSQGCLAVKQVQRSDQDPSILEVGYRGRHTCVIHTETLKNTKKQKNQFAGEESKPAGEFRRFPSFSFLEEEIKGNFELSPATSEYLSTTSSLNGVQTPESGLTDEITLFQMNSDCNSYEVDFDIYNFDFGTNFSFDNLEFQA